MSQFISVFDFPEPGDRYQSARDLNSFINTHIELRRFRDYLSALLGPTKAYHHITYVLGRSLKLYFREHFEGPYFKLLIGVDTLANQALMEATSITLCEQMNATDRLRRREYEVMREITGQVGMISHGFFPDDWDALDRMRKLYAMRAALYAQEVIPEVPRVAEILSREFGGEVALARYTSVDLTEEERLEIRTLVAREAPEDVLDRLDACLPPAPEAWDSELVLRELAEVIVRTYLERIEDDEFMDRWIEKVRPQLGEHGEPREENMLAMEEFLSDNERRSHRRFHDPLYPHVLDLIAKAEASGYPLDRRVLEMAGYGPDSRV